MKTMTTNIKLMIILVLQELFMSILATMIIIMPVRRSTKCLIKNNDEVHKKYLVITSITM